MLFFVFGLPGGFTAWCERAVGELMRRAVGPAPLIRADTLERIAVNAIGSGLARAVVASHKPGGRLRAALVESGAPFVFAHTDARSALLDLVLERGTPLPDAVQRLASGCVTVGGLSLLPGALTLDADRDWLRPAATVARIARHFGLAIDHSEAAALAVRLGDLEPPAPQHDPAAWWSGLTAAEQELAIGALAAFIDDQSESEPLSVTWHHPLFFIGDRPGERANGPIDITGRARCLVHGPEIMLPAGPWALSLTVLVTGAAAEHEFVTEICTERPLASGILRAEREGGASVHIDFALDEASEHPISVRISSQRAAFDGAIEITAAQLVRAPAPPAETESAEFATGEP